MGVTIRKALRPSSYSQTLCSVLTLENVAGCYLPTPTPHLFVPSSVIMEFLVNPRLLCLDFIFQMPLKLDLAMKLNSNQGHVSRSDVCNFYQKLLTLDFPSSFGGEQSCQAGTDLPDRATKLLLMKDKLQSLNKDSLLPHLEDSDDRSISCILTETLVVVVTVLLASTVISNGSIVVYQNQIQLSKCHLVIQDLSLFRTTVA